MSRPKKRPASFSVDGERRAGADGGLALDGAAVALDELVDDRQAQSRALADVLGGEERIPDPRQDVGRDALAVVPDLDLDGAGLARGLDRDRGVGAARQLRAPQNVAP